jgi:hypothetical protein
MLLQQQRYWKEKYIMGKKHYLDQLIKDQGFRFDRLELEGIDNGPVKKIFGVDMGEQEVSLFHPDISRGDTYFEILDRFLIEAIANKKPAPIVRFADGEYAFYTYSLKCNGLYQQAESVAAIKKAMPIHIDALKLLNRSGKLAPLIFPGNVQPKRKTFFSFLIKSKIDDSALRFMDFLMNNKIELTRSNYIPFYVVYAYLASDQFRKMMHEKTLCIIGSEYREDFCRKWFDRCSSKPDIHFVKIPEQHVATQWPLNKEAVLKQIPRHADLCLVGAGIGALLVCVDAAHRLSIPAIDAGHILNMMNDREEKSGGARLYTIRKTKKSDALRTMNKLHE